MSKYTLSTTVDEHIIHLLEGWKNKSQIVEKVLYDGLETEEGINRRIEDSEETTKKLKKIRKDIIERKQKQFESISEELKVFLIGGFKRDEEGRKVEERGVKLILDNHPDKLVLWTGIVNRQFNTAFNPEQLKELIGRLSDDRQNNR